MGTRAGTEDGGTLVDIDERMLERYELAPGVTRVKLWDRARRLIPRLDRHVERMSKEYPGLDFTRADAMRSLLTRALDQIERASAPTKRGGR